MGKAEGFAGNRHQVVLDTVNGYVTKGSYIRSYYCPPVLAKSRTSTASRVVALNLSIYRMSEGGQPFWVKGHVNGAPLQLDRDGSFGRL